MRGKTPSAARFRTPAAFSFCAVPSLIVSKHDLSLSHIDMLYAATLPRVLFLLAHFAVYTLLRAFTPRTPIPAPAPSRLRFTRTSATPDMPLSTRFIPVCDHSPGPARLRPILSALKPFCPHNATTVALERCALTSGQTVGGGEEGISTGQHLKTRRPAAEQSPLHIAARLRAWKNLQARCTKTARISSFYLVRLLFYAPLIRLTDSANSVAEKVGGRRGVPGKRSSYPVTHCEGRADVARALRCASHTQFGREGCAPTRMRALPACCSIYSAVDTLSGINLPVPVAVSSENKGGQNSRSHMSVPLSSTYACCCLATIALPQFTALLLPATYTPVLACPPALPPHPPATLHYLF